MHGRNCWSPPCTHFKSTTGWGEIRRKQWKPGREHTRNFTHSSSVLVACPCCSSSAVGCMILVIAIGACSYARRILQSSAMFQKSIGSSRSPHCEVTLRELAHTCVNIFKLRKSTSRTSFLYRHSHYAGGGSIIPARFPLQLRARVLCICLSNGGPLCWSSWR